VWERTRSNFSGSRGLELPAFERAGAFFTIGPDNKPSKVWVTGNFSHNFLQQLFCAMIDIVRSTPSPEQRESSFGKLNFTYEVRSYVKETVLSAVWALIIAFAVRAFFYQPFNIPSGSMKSTLLVGDYLFVSKLAYGYSRYSFPGGIIPFDGRIFATEPKRGDVAVFKLPRDNSTDYVKRVIGLPGDEILVRDGIVVVNGEALPQKPAGAYVGPEEEVKPRYEETLPIGVKHYVLHWQHETELDNVGPFKVPAGHYFMMGDNRDDSIDSRVQSSRYGVGYVPYENLIGRAEILFFSMAVDDPRAFLLTSPWTWPFDVRWSRMLSKVK
jgi:signal peptidase I